MMRINHKGELEYTPYGSVSGYYCKHCAKELVSIDPRGGIYNETMYSYFKLSNKVRCCVCSNLAESIVKKV